MSWLLEQYGNGLISVICRTRYALKSFYLFCKQCLDSAMVQPKKAIRPLALSIFGWSHALECQPRTKTFAVCRDPRILPLQAFAQGMGRGGVGVMGRGGVGQDGAGRGGVGWCGVGRGGVGRDGVGWGGVGRDGVG